MTTKYKVTPEYVQSMIVGKTFTILPSGKVMVCELTLKNGFTVRGEASVVDPANFVQAIGEEKSYARAVEQVWVLAGFAMQELMYKDQQV